PVLDYRDVLDSLGIIGGYDIYEPAIYGIPDSTVLPSYSSVVWNGDWGYGTILTKESAGNVLYDYMVNGGNIFFGSDEILGLWDGWSNVSYSPGEFPYDVLKVTYIYNDINYDSVYGVTGDTISDGIIAGMTFPVTNWNDEVDIDASAIAIFTDAAATTIRGLRWDDANNKVVFIPFMYVSLPKNIQITVMRNVLTWFGIQTGISMDDNEGATIPRIFALSQNRPNPFNKRTTICYSIPRKTNVTLRIYNAAGQLVRTLVNGNEEPGYKNVIWNGLDKNNKRVAQGVYFYRLTAGSFIATKKVLVLR
ncbi:T9SS type A sorting domain-containing protein, partial [candidate division WOR-3 bacterium]|nr:T9SS type A sorting domain-containing protein [candidate division WOR-3 bacterium]